MNEIDLNKEFYIKESVEKSILAFKGVCKIELKDQGKFLHLKFSPLNDTYSRNLELEFCNYVLAVMKNENLV